MAELQEILGMGQSRISSQLALLRQGSVVSDRREGKNAFYSLRAQLPPRTLALIKAAIESLFGVKVTFSVCVPALSRSPSACTGPARSR